MANCYMLVPVIALAVLAGPGSGNAGEVYKWLDNKDQVQFSDRAPAGRKTETTDIKSSYQSAYPPGADGLRDAERKLLEKSGRREKEVMQARQRFVGKQAAVKSRCRAARNRYDHEKRKPGGSRSLLVSSYYEEMRELCR